MIGEASSVVLKDNSSGNGGGSTFAFEVGGQTMVCPIIVEDLHPPGQMLVEVNYVFHTTKHACQDIDLILN